MTDINIIRNFCSNKENKLLDLSETAKTLLKEKSTLVLNDGKNPKRKIAIEILETLNPIKSCIFDYKILEFIDNENGLKLRVENKLDKNEYNMEIVGLSLDDIQTTIIIYNRLLNLYKTNNLFNIFDIQNYCIISNKELNSFYKLNKNKELEIYINNTVVKNNLITIYNREYIKITEENFTNENLFELFYNILVLMYNDIIIEDLNIIFMKYDKSIKYSICDSIFISPIMKYRIKFLDPQLLIFNIDISNDNILTSDILENGINQILDDIKFNNEITKFIRNNKDIPALDILLSIGKLIFKESKKISSHEKLTFNCKKEINLESEIPPKIAYEQKEYNYPRYIHTGRPKSYMIQMCKKVVDEKEFEVCSKNNIFLPIIRYQSLYHSEHEKSNYCGTFYYFEPESTILLNLGKCAMFATKIHAYIVLRSVLKKKTKEEILNKIFNLNKFDNFEYVKDMTSVWVQVSSSLIDQEEDEKKRKDKTKELMTQFYIPLLYSETDAKEIPIIETTPLYPTDKSKLFYSGKKIAETRSYINFTAGIHDNFDQDICNMARKLNIDTLILQHEIGETRSVTEILDTRIDTYNNLIRIKDKKDMYKVNKKYPTIFFLDSGFITNMKCKKIDIDRDNINILKCNN